MNMRGKKGQFYLLAAIVIIGVILGFAGISNYSKKKEDVKIYDIGDELGIESGEVLDFGTYNQYDESGMKNLLVDFNAMYTDYAGEGKNVYYVFGNKDKITIAGYSELIAGTISVDYGSTSGPSVLIISEKGYITEEFNPKGNKIIVTIEGNEYEFELKQGENFYFVISQEIGGEKYIATG